MAETAVYISMYVTNRLRLRPQKMRQDQCHEYVSLCTPPPYGVPYGVEKYAVDAGAGVSRYISATHIESTFHVSQAWHTVCNT